MNTSGEHLSPSTLSHQVNSHLRPKYFSRVQFRLNRLLSILLTTRPLLQSLFKYHNLGLTITHLSHANTIDPPTLPPYLSHLLLVQAHLPNQLLIRRRPDFTDAPINNKTRPKAQQPSKLENMRTCYWDFWA